MREWNAQNPDKVKASRERNKEKRNAYCRAHYAANTETRKAQMKAWRDANPEKHREAVRNWKAANPEKAKVHEVIKRKRHGKAIQARQKRWRDANPEKVAAQSAAAVHKRRARVGDAVLTGKQIAELRETADGVCAYCLQPCDALQLEHCIPLARGGAHEADNIVFACPSCNASKGTRTPLEFLCGLPRLGAAA